MAGQNTSLRVAAVQAAPIFLNREATVRKACSLIEEAGSHGAGLVAFPEVFIPGYPYWARYLAPFRGDVLTKELVLQSVRIPSDESDALCEAAQRANIHVVIGINERDPRSAATIYNTNLIIDSGGRILGKHHKLVPTFAEKLVWSTGDGLGMKVYDTEIGKLGTLICAQNTNPLARFVLIAEGEQIHVANYLSMPARDPAFASFAREVELRSSAHALEGRLFNIVSSSLIDESVLEVLRPFPETCELLQTGNSCHTAVHGPNGFAIAGPLDPNKEDILYADIGLDDLILPKLRYDISTSSYNRFDLMRVQMERRRLDPFLGPDDEGGKYGSFVSELRSALKQLRSLLEQGDIDEARERLKEWEQRMEEA
jgi:aliphatic nitrilase